MKHSVGEKTYQDAIAICGKKKAVTLPFLQYKLQVSYDTAGQCVEMLIKNGILKKKDEDSFEVISLKERELEHNNKDRRLAAIVANLSREAKLFCAKYLPQMPIEGGYRVYRLISNDDIKEILVQLHEYEIIEFTPHSITVKLNDDELSLFLSQIKEKEQYTDAEKSKVHFRFERGRKEIRDFFDQYNDDDETEEDNDDEKDDDKEEDDDIKKLLEDVDCDSEDITLNVRSREEESVQLNLFSEELLKADIADLLKSQFIMTTSDNQVEIPVTRNDTTITLSIIKTDGRVYISDNAGTFDYMKNEYELDANDVKNCINTITDHYGVIMQSSDDDERITLIKYVEMPDNLLNTFREFYDCIVQLMDMSLFFEESDGD